MLKIYVRKIRVLVAEDNLLVREGLVSLLDGYEAIDTVAACTSLADALAQVEVQEPDVVLTDIRMPPGHADEGIQIARHLRRHHPKTAVLVLSAFADPAYALALFKDGTRARGYLMKDRVDEPDYLFEAIRSVDAGSSFIDDDIIDSLVRGRAEQAPIDALTPREYEVLAELATGRNNAAIAEQLNLSEHSVEKHTSGIFAKLELTGDRQVNRRVKAVLLFLAGRAAA